MLDCKNKQALTSHIQDILAFYAPNVLDEVNGGFHQNYYDNGDVFDLGKKHLVSSTRMIFNYCKAYQHFQREEDLKRVEHGLAYLLTRHWDEERKAYNWFLDANTPVDQTNHAYGLAFVILALATCVKTGLKQAEVPLYQAWGILNERFWQDSYGCYADEASPDWSTLGTYRGQNANMHCCEALLIAFDATQDEAFLTRAYTLAKTFAVDKAAQTQGLIWEHYHADMSIDWEYNKDDPKNLYRPWGFQPGHQTEWTKLLLILHRHQPESWMVERAQALFDSALSLCWDEENGGIFYGHAPNGEICDSDKYFWVQAESLAAAALLAKATGNDAYWQWYEKIWAYCWNAMIDHTYGSWYRVLTADNKPYSNEKSLAGAKCDYHTQGALWEIIEQAL